MQTAVHQLWPPPGDLRKTEMNILFFHGFPRDPDEWKSAWTQLSHPDVCWPEKWLPADLGFDVRVLFVSYGPSPVAVVVDDLFKALIIRDEWDLCKNHQPLVLVGRGFGTQVLDNLFLKATEELLTSPTEAGAFVRNVRGVTLYGDNTRYKIEKFFGGKLVDFEPKLEDSKRGPFSVSICSVFITQGSMLINPAIYGKNLARDVVGMDPCQWIKEAIWSLNNEVWWKPGNKQSRGYNLLLESCRMVYQFEAIHATLEHLQQKLDNITTACDISNYSDSMFENEFTYLRHNGIEGAKILIVQRMLATKGVDVEQHMVVKKSDDGEQLENERKLAILKLTVAGFCENHEWHMVPEMRESDMQTKIKSVLNDIVDGIPPLSDDIMNKKMHRERGRESIYHPDREAFRRDGNDTVPIHFPSSREQSIKSVKQLQQLACNMRLGENLPQEDVQEQLTAHMAQVLHGGKLIVTAKILEGKIQFLFGNAKSMAQIVGVGLDFATVSITHQNVIVVEGITELEWTRLWGKVFVGESLFENPIFMEKVVISPPDHEKPQGSHVNALSKVAMFFMIQKFQQNVDFGKVYNQVVRGVATTMTEENQSDIGQVHAKSVNDPSTGILGFNLWDYLSRLQITRGLASATRDTSAEGGSHLGGTGTPSEGDKDQGGDGELGGATRDTSGEGGSHLGGADTPSEEKKGQGGDGGEDDDNRKGREAREIEIRENIQRDVLVTVHTGYEHAEWDRAVPEELQNSYIEPTLEFLFRKTDRQKSNTIESKVEVCCAIRQDQVNDCLKRFGWCQNQLHVALQCLGRDAAKLCGGSRSVGTEDSKNIYTVQREATSSQATFGAKVDLGFASASASCTSPLTSTLQSRQRAIEIPCEFIKGTGFQPQCHNNPGPTPILGYDFNYSPKLLTNVFPDESVQDNSNGMRCTVHPSFKGVWGLLSPVDVCEYELRVKREVFELNREKKPLCNTMWQTYKVKLYINHKMSNIETLPKSGTDILSKTDPNNALIGLRIHPRGFGSDCASSSTQ